MIPQELPLIIAFLKLTLASDVLHVRVTGRATAFIEHTPVVKVGRYGPVGADDAPAVPLVGDDTSSIGVNHG